MIYLELRKLIEAQSELLANIEKRLQKIQIHMRWATISSWLRILLILVPLVLGYIYLSPYINDLVAQYQEIMQIQRNTSEQINKYLPR